MVSFSLHFRDASLVANLCFCRDKVCFRFRCISLCNTIGLESISFDIVKLLAGRNVSHYFDHIGIEPVEEVSKWKPHGRLSTSMGKGLVGVE